MWLNTKRVAKIKRQSLLLYFSAQSIKWDYFAIIQQSFNLLEQKRKKKVSFCLHQIIIILILFMPSCIGKKEYN